MMPVQTEQRKTIGLLIFSTHFLLQWLEILLDALKVSPLDWIMKLPQSNQNCSLGKKIIRLKITLLKKNVLKNETLLDCTYIHGQFKLLLQLDNNINQMTQFGDLWNCISRSLNRIVSECCKSGNFALIMR